MKSSKFTIILIMAAIIAVTASCYGGKTSTEKQPSNITKADVDSVSYMMGYSFGMQIKESSFGALENSKILEGMKDASKGVDIDYQEFQRVVKGFLNKRHTAIAEEMTVRSKKYLDEKRMEEGIDSTKTGLLYKIEQAGNNLHATALDTVEVNYEGTNLDGEIFDSTYKKGTSARFPLGAVIPGWSEGMQLVGEGGVIYLYIPAKLAYGERGGGSKIRPNEALTFKVELLKVIKYQPKN